MYKADSMQKQMGRISRQMGILRQNQKEMLKIKNTEMKDAFDEYISRLDMTGERMFKLDTSTKTFVTGTGGSRLQS
jgi:hypothetical protein